MASAKPRRRLIVNADDFGASKSINAAVIDAHRRGILTSASLMVNGAAVEEAIDLAKANPKLGVGLHLTLCCGTSALPPSKIPRLVNARSEFRNSPVLAGMLYFFSPSARRQLADEIAAQFEKFACTGLLLDHVNGHLHFHLHPAVFAILRRELKQRKVRALRLTNDPLWIDWPLGTGRWCYRLSHAFIFSALAKRARGFLRENGIQHTRSVFGLLENARVTEDYILQLLPQLPEGDSELYSHPSLDEFKEEYNALVSPRVLESVRAEEIELIRYQDLWRNW
jgi:hopanoid biosynthesis associated protein HpnK